MTLVELVRSKEPDIHVFVSDEHADEYTMYCTVTWQWQADNGDYAYLETTGLINAPNVDNEIDIETIAYDFADCEGGFSHRLTDEEEWELDDLMLEQATKRSPIHYPYTLEIA